jgi:hypothetical protein
VLALIVTGAAIALAGATIELILFYFNFLKAL